MREPREYKPPEQPGCRDYFEIVITILMVILGIGILFRSIQTHAPIIAYILGLAFLVVGVYRAYYILKYFTNRGAS